MLHQCIICFLGLDGFDGLKSWIWSSVGLNLVAVTGFIPTPLGEIFEYTMTMMEIGVSVGIYGLGAFVFTILTKVAIEVELGRTGKLKKF